MKRLRQLGLFCVLLLVFSSSWAEENKEFLLLPKDIYFQPGGGLRVRYENLREATGGAFSSEEDDSNVTHRAQFDFKLYKGEYFETFFRFLHVGQWGATTGDTSAGQRDGFTSNNGVTVNQAYALWKVDDSLGFRFGRSPIVLGRGLTYGENDWFNVPYSFDHFDVSWDWESVELELIFAKAQELTTVAGQTLSNDPEESHTIIDVDVKNMSDMVDVFDFHFVQVNRDLGSSDGGTTVLNGMNMQRFAFDLAIKAKQFQLGLFLSYVTGEERVADINKADPVNDPEKLSINQVAADIEVGYVFPESNNLHLWGGYHYDTGDSGSTDESDGYDSFYYEVYGNAGRMDFLRWGNLSFYKFGLDVDLSSRVNLGAEWISFSKTEPTGSVNFGDAGRYMKSKVDTADIVLGSSKDLGNEFDIWLDYGATSGVNVRSTIAVFFPGDTFGSATTTSGSLPNTTVYQVLTQVGFFF